MDQKSKSEHLLSLKVMRLTKPTIVTPVTVTCDSADLPGNTLNNALKEDCTALQGMESLAVGQFMVLPQSFGTIYLGEIFASYLCVHNGSNQAVRNVSVKADLQTSSQNLRLSNKHVNIEELEWDEVIDEVILHEVKEIGTHILVCEIAYTPSAPGGQPTSFRKFFKFQVLKPLDIKTKLYNAESNEVYVEAQIQNLTVSPICLEKVSLESPSFFEVTSWDENDEGQSIFGGVNVLEPNRSRQYLYSLKPQPSLLKEPKMLRNVTQIGKLDIVWRTNMGERGRLQTSQLQRMVPDYGDLRVTAKDIPSELILEGPIEFNCHIVNISERTMELTMSLESNDSIAWCGVSDVMVGSLKPGASTDVPLCLVPLRTGLLTITGLKLTDPLLKRVYDYNDIALILVS